MEEASDNKGVNTANVAAAVFFWPAAVGNYMNAADAEKLVELAGRQGCSAAQLAIAWMMRRNDTPVIPIIGARKLDQLTDNLGAAALELEDDLVAELDALTAPDLRYPNTLYASDFFRTMMYGEAWQTLSLDRPWT